MDTFLKYFMPAVITAVFFIVLLKSCNDRENCEKEFRRDAVLEMKIDSLKSAVTEIDDKLLQADFSINESSRQIKKNKLKYEENKKLLYKTPADSIYNWTRSRLVERAK